MAETSKQRARPDFSLRALVLWTVGVLVALLIATTVVTSVARLLNANALSTLQTRWLPAQKAAGALTTAYVDQESGARGYLLSGEARFLQPYRAGVARQVALQRQLQELLGSDASAERSLHAVELTGRQWRVEASQPAIDARRAGAMSLAQLRTYDTRGKALFDTLRAHLAVLRARSADLVAGELDAVNLRQTVANVVAAVALALALSVGALSVPFLRRTIIRPLEALVARLRTVADGHYERPIDLEQGPLELRTIANAAEQMRDGVVRGSAALAEAQKELSLRDERDRIAADLHDHTIQRLFALGLSLSAATSRDPELAPALVPMIEESDGIIRELRGFIYGIKSAASSAGLAAALARLVGDSAGVLGFMPETVIGAEIDKLGGSDLASELTGALREALSNVARHAHATRVAVSVTIEDDVLCMRVADNGVGFDLDNPRSGEGLRNIRARARRHGGSAEITSSADAGTAVEWRVPVESGSRPH